MEKNKREEYDLVAVRDLLHASYSTETLRRFLLYSDNPNLQMMYDELAPSDSLPQMAEKVMDLAMKRQLLDELLAAVAADNPAQYARLASQLPAVQAKLTSYTPPGASDFGIGYRLSVVRDLLQFVFDDMMLRRFVQDRNAWRPLSHQLSSNDSLAVMVEKVIVYARQRAMLDELLAEVAEAFPRQHASFADRLRLIQSTQVPDHNVQVLELDPRGANSGKEYEQSDVRDLLLKAFSLNELRRFLKMRPLLAPVLDELQAGDSLAITVDRVITFAMRQALLDELLTEVAKSNPRQYASFADRLGLMPSKPATETRAEIRERESLGSDLGKDPDSSAMGDGAAAKAGAYISGPVVTPDRITVSEWGSVAGVYPPPVVRVTSMAHVPPPMPDLDTLTDPGALPPGSQLPFVRNAIFTGREKELKALARGLLGEGATPRVVVAQAISGMGGVGKTQLAVEFAWRYGRFFHGVYWVSAAQPEQIDAEIAACGEALGLEPWPQDLPAQVRRTLAAWGEGGPRLVVLDHLEDVEAAREWWPRLTVAGMRLLVTARHSEWPRHFGLAQLRLRVFTRQDSVAFLRQYVGERRAGVRALDALAERLGDLPLALEMAGLYLERQPRLKVEEYVGRLESVVTHESMTDWMREVETATGYDADLAATFTLSWEQVQDKGARRVLLAASWCAPNQPIPSDLLIEATALNRKEYTRALSTLARLGLLEVPEETTSPTIHPLAAEYTQGMGKASEDERFEPLVAIAKALENATYDALETRLPAEFAPLRGHVRAVAAAAERMRLEVAGILWNNLGVHLDDIADYQGALDALERALKVDEEILGPEHENVALRLSNLGSSLKHLGRFGEAQAAFERALAIDEALFGPEHENVAGDLKRLGEVLYELANWAGAREAIERALRIDEARFGPQDPEMARGSSSLGRVLNRLADFAGARAAVERALEIDAAVSEREHPDVARDCQALGEVLEGIGDYAGARAAFERALVIDEAVFGPEHPNVARDVNNLAAVLLNLGRLEEARAAGERALAINEEVFGPGHPNVARDLNCLGLVLKAQGHLGVARATLERALAIDETVFGREHPNVARTVRDLAAVLHLICDLEGARAAYERALTIDEVRLGAEHPDVATDLVPLGSVLYDLGSWTEAVAHLDRAIALNPKSAPAHYNRGLVQASLGNLQGALVDYDQAIDLDPSDARIYTNRGIVRRDLGDLQRAVDDHAQAIDLNPNDASGYYNRGSTLQDMGELQAAVADYNQAIELDPKWAAVYHARGTAYKKLGHLSRAVDDYDRVIELSPDGHTHNSRYYAEVYHEHGNMRRDAGDLQGAVVNYDRAIDLDPDLVAAYSGRGWARARLGDLEGAIADYDRAIELNTEDVWAYNSRGAARETQGDLAGAAADFQQCIEIDPDWAYAYNNLAQVYVHLGRIKEAKPLLERCITLQPEGALDAQVGLGMLAWFRGDKEDAEKRFTAALDVWEAAWEDGLQTEAGVLENKAFALLGLGRHEEAVVALREALASFGPNDMIDRTWYDLLAQAPEAPVGLPEMRAVLEEAVESGCPVWRFVVVK
ncbi:MAG: tetratricopeptide repeat protein [Anaerolineae bacterium]|nr:tetratricopeptide repeat protein [Anaerolineae bacterium]